MRQSETGLCPKSEQKKTLNEIINIRRRISCPASRNIRHKVTTSKLKTTDVCISRWPCARRSRDNKLHLRNRFCGNVYRSSGCVQRSDLGCGWLKRYSQRYTTGPNLPSWVRLAYMGVIVQGFMEWSLDVSAHRPEREGSNQHFQPKIFRDL